MSTIAGLTASGLLGLAIAHLMRLRGQAKTSCIAAAALCVANPFAWDAVRLGHGEELLAGALCVGAVLAARRRRTLLGAALLGLALATAQWAAIAILPVLAAARTRRVRLLAMAAAVALPFMLPLQGGDTVWPVLASVPLTALWWSSRRRTPDDVLALVGLLLLLRAALEPGTDMYLYAPFLLSLVAWEGLTRRGMPVVSLVSAAALATQYVPAMLVLGAWVAVRLFAPSFRWRRRAWPLPARHEPRTIS